MNIQEIIGQSTNQIPIGLQGQKQFVKQEGASVNSVEEHMQINIGYTPPVSEKVIVDAIEDANKKLEGANREFEFSIHKKTKQIMIKVVDTSTKEVVREIPSEKILDMVAAMCENAGLFVDKKV